MAPPPSSSPASVMQFNVVPSNEREEHRRARSMRSDREGRDKKRQKNLTDELVCPITLELPLDPVVAEDGRVYERCAIEQHINGKSSAELTSPMTSIKMGKRLVPAIQHKNLIQTMIETGVLAGDSADDWKKRAKQKKDMEDLIKQAEDGNAEAMLKIALKFQQGVDGFKKDLKLAYTWNKRAHDSGIIGGTARIGNALLNGEGVTRNNQEGIMFITMAAAQGSEYASFKLGFALAHGMYGLPVNKPEAIKWLQKSLSGECKVHHLSASGKRKAQKELDELVTSCN